jgi:glucose-6-phosphate isomerase
MLHEELLFDFSKNRITQETLDLLISLANECELKKAIEGMFEGEPINETENRAVLHTALRNRSDKPLFVDGKNIMRDISQVLEQMRNFCEKIHSGYWKG